MEEKKTRTESDRFDYDGTIKSETIDECFSNEVLLCSPQILSIYSVMLCPNIFGCPHL